MTKQEEQALLDRVAHLETIVAGYDFKLGHLDETIKRLEARLEVRIRQHDATIQVHCDNALALRQISGALEDLVRRGTR